ncbi:hypothetical protein C8J55DRAFT_553656 [Lentinula edodes]|uniref:Uncharacterized protein n=1 Tax=Lentinula lateritia TaxID=40482 RepID=A0A9W9B2J2_9AGAR|nr:hypothetical protein C8J55DRAFT_553656 [Lentinula edodes]
MDSAQYDIALAYPPTNVDNNTKAPFMDADSSTTTMDVDSPTTMNVDSSILDIDSSTIVGHAVPNFRFDSMTRPERLERKRQVDLAISLSRARQAFMRAIRHERREAARKRRDQWIQLFDQSRTIGSLQPINNGEDIHQSYTYLTSPSIIVQSSSLVDDNFVDQRVRRIFRESHNPEDVNYSPRRRRIIHYEGDENDEPLPHFNSTPPRRVPQIAPEPLFYSSPTRCPIGQPLQQLDNQFHRQQQSQCAPATSEKRITDVDHDAQIFMTPGNQALGQQPQQQEAAGVPQLASRTDIHQASNRALGQQRRRAREATEKALAQHGHRHRQCEPSKNVATPSNRVLGQQRRRAREAAEKASAQHERQQCEPSKNAATLSNRVLGQQRRRAREAAEKVLTQHQRQPPEPPINTTTPSNQALGQQRCHRAYEVAATQQSSTPRTNNRSLGQQRRRTHEQEERLQVLTPGASHCVKSMPRASIPPLGIPKIYLLL